MRTSALYVAILSAWAVVSAAPSANADGEILLTETGALAGNVTPGDAPGFPITLSVSGSYELASNLDVPSDTNGILVTASDVTIDLNSFRLKGAAGGTNAWGITGAVNNVTILDGIVTGFRTGGIYGGAGWAVQSLQVITNGVGISLGYYGRVKNNTVTNNNNGGISCSVCLVEGNIVASNGSDGIAANSASVLGNLIWGNQYLGVKGNYATGFGNNTITGNNGPGPEVFHVLPINPNACIPGC